MSQFIETIKLADGEYQHLDLHVQRIQDTCLQYYGRLREMQDIQMALESVQKKEEIYKVSLIYDFDFCTVEANLYHKRSIQHLVLMEDNALNYQLKFANRSLLAHHQRQAGNGNECIIVQNNRITDTSFSNLAFWDGNEWHTPLHPLLRGTKRKFLLETGLLHEADILVEDLPKYTKVSLINAMLELGDLEIDIHRIRFLSNL
jgi:4-amino-4-deoxychorismate lyase